MPGAAATLRLQLPELSPGRHEIQFAVNTDAAPGAIRLVTELTVPEFYRADYGERIEGISGTTAVWWCDCAVESRPHAGRSDCRGECRSAFGRAQRFRGRADRRLSSTSRLPV